MNVQLLLLRITLLESSTVQGWPRTISIYFAECLEALPACKLHDLLSVSPKCSQPSKWQLGTIPDCLVSSLQPLCPSLYLTPSTVPHCSSATDSSLIFTFSQKPQVKKGWNYFFFIKRNLTSLSSPTSNASPLLFLALTLRPNTLLFPKTDLSNHSYFDRVPGPRMTLQESCQPRAAKTEEHASSLGFHAYVRLNTSEGIVLECKYQFKIGFNLF